jgi:hypothetical protein
MSRKIFSLILLLATPALGAVTITCSDEGSGIVAIYYDAGTDNVRAFALDVTIDSNCTTIEGITDYSGGEGDKYGIFPGSIDLSDVNNPAWGTPIAPSDDPGAEGTGLGASRVILEMGTLYETTAPSTTGLLCKLQLGDFDGYCHVSIAVESTRGGVVLEDGTSVNITSPGCEIGWLPRPCWLYPTQCHGDADGDCDVDIVDWPYFRDGFGHVPPDPDYEHCADYDRDEDVDIVDWPQFRDNFGKTCATGLAQDCNP